MYWLSWNLGALTPWNPLGLYGEVLAPHCCLEAMLGFAYYPFPIYNATMHHTIGIIGIHFTDSTASYLDFTMFRWQETRKVNKTITGGIKALRKRFRLFSLCGYISCVPGLWRRCSNLWSSSTCRLCWPVCTFWTAKSLWKLQCHQYVLQIIASHLQYQSTSTCCGCPINVSLQSAVRMWS